QSEKESDKTKDLGEELADVIFVALCLANQTGVDLETAFYNKIKVKTERDKDRHQNNQKLQFHPSQNIEENHLNLSGSKSESNRLLVLNALLKGDIEICNLSNSQDTQLIDKALSSTEEVVDIYHAGTAMRFLTAYFSLQEGRKTFLTGSARMKERPIQILVDALRDLGADITYAEQEGFPPLHIKGKKIIKNEVTLSASISSQYISALLLIGGFLENGITIHLEGTITSLPYLNMTIQMLNRVRIKAMWLKEQSIKVFPYKKETKMVTNVESDWSSASYLYSIIALSKTGSLFMDTYFKDSLQGDKALVEIYRDYFNVDTEFILENNSKPQIRLTKGNKLLPSKIELDLNNCPDIAQTILVTAVGLKIPFKLTGLSTLKIKETDRLVAMQNELAKCNVQTEITEDSISLVSYEKNLPQTVKISTYNDHRMAMSFVPLALKGTNLIIENPNVVEKSYTNFWKDMKKLGFEITKIEA
ncbi:unnamed protein product, partial [Darwinula stevensoni]